VNTNQHELIQTEKKSQLQKSLFVTLVLLTNVIVVGSSWQIIKYSQQMYCSASYPSSWWLWQQISSLFSSSYHV